MPATEAIAPVGINLSETGVKLEVWGEERCKGKGGGQCERAQRSKGAKNWRLKKGPTKEKENKKEVGGTKKKAPVCSHPHHMILKPSGPTLMVVILRMIKLMPMMMVVVMMKMMRKMRKKMALAIDLVSSQVEVNMVGQVQRCCCCHCT